METSWKFAIAGFFAGSLATLSVTALTRGKGLESPKATEEPVATRDQTSKTRGRTPLRETHGPSKETDKIDLPEFERRWTESKQVDQKLQELWNVSKNSDPLEVLAFIMEAQGAGSDRERMVRAIFAADSIDPEKFQKMYGMLKTQGERKNATDTLSTRIARADSIHDFRGFLSLDIGGLQVEIAEGLGTWVGRHSGKGMVAIDDAFLDLRTFIQSAPPGQRQALLEKALYASSLNKEGAFGAWSYVATQEPTGEKMSKNLRQRLVYEMFRTDQKQALDILGSGNDANAFGDAMKYLFDKDDKAALQWVQTAPISNSKNQDIANSAAAKSLLKKAEFDSAKEFVTRISDPEIRSTTEEAIRKAESQK
jgi:hypothetical protein